ncbi:isocitrate/isopropylmalate family dehydrogenase [Nocardioides rotundus]|uniref:isocitrate/isopropylmalate family dehydrogenase n=1 Tax=Nocardioides rotundus TaxID=1774216 RepID=UPI001CBF4B8C|nr:isocitrate/isopropylmalate family dehydrogenase [Nocardioides rotundus]
MPGTGHRRELTPGSTGPNEAVRGGLRRPDLLGRGHLGQRDDEPLEHPAQRVEEPQQGGIERIASYAFERARERSGSVTSATKSNGIIHTMPFWGEVVVEVFDAFASVLAADGPRTRDLGGTASTDEFTQRVLDGIGG